MFTLIFIIGLLVILWPVIGGAIASLFNCIVIVASSPFYWILRLIKRPKNSDEDDKISKIASSIAMCIVITAIFATLLIVFL